MPGSLIPAQVRAARGFAGWTQAELADAAGVSVSTVRDFEAERRVPHANNLDAIRRALEQRHIEFTNGMNPGVRYAFVSATPHQHDGVWHVLTVWRLGAPAELVLPEIALKAADTAEARGAAYVAAALRDAAQKAIKSGAG